MYTLSISFSKSTIIIVMMGIIITGLLSYNFMSASTAWIGPTATPPVNNIDRPLNVSADPQTKPGDLTVQNLWGNNLIYGTYVGAGAQVRSPQYCDSNGANCFTAQQLTKLLSYGGGYIYSYGYGGINARQASCIQINAMTGDCSCMANYNPVVVRKTYTQGNCTGSQQNCVTVPNEDTVSCVAK